MLHFFKNILRRSAVPLCAAALAAAFVLINPAVLALDCYSDVHENDWFYENIYAMSRSGLLSGYPDGSFCPYNEISAAEFITVTARIAGIDEKNPPNSHWAGGLMQAALDKGWYDWDEVPPTGEKYDDAINRQLAVKIVINAFMPEARGDYSVQSSKISDFPLLDGRYYNAVIAAYENKIVFGDSGGCFRPKSPLTRAEACALIARAASLVNSRPLPSPAPSVPALSARGGISENGALIVSGANLTNSKGETVVLHGMSTHGIQWYPNFINENVLYSLKDSGANLIRIALYTQEGGYLSNPGLKQVLTNAVDMVTQMDMYAIIDWHILSDGNPNAHISEAKSFFSQMAARYRDNPGVIFEICNEPNGNVTWSKDIKPYAEEIISVIRAAGSNAVILVGSPTYSQDLHEAAKNPINAENIMYTCHFYAGTHTGWLRDRISDARNRGLAVFVSEWGTSDASGSGGVYIDESQKWIDFMRQNNISWANWSLCDKNESSAAVVNGADISDGISQSELSESGRFVWKNF